MTETEWLTCTDPVLMLEFLEGKVSDRKLRLFAVACCREILGYQPLECFVRAVECAELFADGQTKKDELDKVAMEIYNTFARPYPWMFLNEAAPCAFRSVVSSDWCIGNCRGCCRNAATVQADHRHNECSRIGKMPSRKKTLKRIHAEQACLLRDIFGTFPFRPISLDTTWLAWNDATVKKIAQAINDDRAFERLPILADALEEAGCTNEDILNHCRSDGPHVRGCWAVDLFLSKE